MICISTTLWIYRTVKLRHRPLVDRKSKSMSLDLDWYAEASMIFSGYTHTASVTETSKHVRMFLSRPIDQNQLNTRILK